MLPDHPTPIADVTGLTLRVRLAADLDAPRSARATAARLCPLMDPAALEDLRLLVSELVTNSVRHAGLTPSDSIELTFSVEPTSVKVSVTDSGSGFASLDPRPPGEYGGWGLALVERLTRTWGIESNGRVRVWFEIGRQHAGHGTGR